MRVSALRTGQHYPPPPKGNIAGAHLCYRATVRAVGLTIKNSNDAMGNRTGDFPLVGQCPINLRHGVPPERIRSSPISESSCYNCYFLKVFCNLFTG